MRANGRRARFLLLAIGAMGAGDASPARAAACTAPSALVDTSNPDVFVGTGTPASRNETAFANALAVGRVITSDCGAAPVSIPIASSKGVTHDTVLDGRGVVTLDGGGTTRILSVPSSFELGTPTLTVQRLAFSRSGSGSVAGDDTTRGGGVYIDGVGQNVSLCGVQFEEDSAKAFSGGLFRVSNNGVGAMEIDRSSVLANTIPDQSPSRRAACTCGRPDRHERHDGRLESGGPTLTIRLAADSPAITLGASCPAEDQRGVVRPAGACTAGAVELAPEAGVTLLQSAAFALALGLGARDVQGRRAP
jgi:hypothetical protein